MCRVNPLHIVGVGGIGCAVGYALCAAGARVVLVDADAETVQWGRANGVRIGRPRVNGDPSLLVSLLRRRAPFRVKVVPDILPYKYTKLMYNAAISPLAAAAGLDNGELLRVPAARRLFFTLLSENYRILREAGV